MLTFPPSCPQAKVSPGATIWDDLMALLASASLPRGTSELTRVEGADDPDSARRDDAAGSETGSDTGSWTGSGTGSAGDRRAGFDRSFDVPPCASVTLAPMDALEACW